MADNSSLLYVGVDVGGTKIEAALVRGSGEVVARTRRSTPRGATGRQNLKAIMDTIAEVLSLAHVKSRDLAAIGIGLPGVVDPAKGVLVYAPNLNVADLNFVKPMGRRFGVPVAIGNDVNVGTLGEQWLGAARGLQSAFGIFVGTGIGGGLIMDGKLVIGARDAAAEIGHIVMQPDGPKCGCGRKGCFEALASRTAIERDIRSAVKAGRKTLLTKLLDGDLSSIRSKALSKALRKGDPLVTEVVRRAAHTLGYACVTVRHLADPEVIILGGGVIEACGDYIMPVVEKIVNARSMPGAPSNARVVRSELGDDAVVLGGVALAQQMLGTATSAGAAAGVIYSVVAQTTTGKVTIGRETYTRDVYIRADGTVKKRRKSFLKVKTGQSSTIGVDELDKVVKGAPAILIVGTGPQRCAVLTKEARDMVRERRIVLKAMPNRDAIRLYNGTKGRKAFLIHVAC